MPVSWHAYGGGVRLDPIASALGTLILKEIAKGFARDFDVNGSGRGTSRTLRRRNRRGLQRGLGSQRQNHGGWFF